MGVSDANPAGGDSPAVAALKQQLAEQEAKEAAEAASAETGIEVASSDPPAQPADSGGGSDSVEKTPEVLALEAELADTKAKLDAMANTVQAQKNPETADPNLDVAGLLKQIASAQSDLRAEVEQLRAENAKLLRRPVPTSQLQRLSAEQLLAIRLQEIDGAPYYCPGCGALYQYQRECTGRAASPHPAIDVAPTDELKNPPDPVDKDAVAEYQAGHTKMKYADPETDERLLGA